MKEEITFIPNPFAEIQPNSPRSVNSVHGIGKSKANTERSIGHTAFQQNYDRAASVLWSAWVGRKATKRQSYSNTVQKGDGFAKGFSINLLSAFPNTEVCVVLEDSRVDEQRQMREGEIMYGNLQFPNFFIPHTFCFAEQ